MEIAESMEGESEMKNLLKVCVSVGTCLCYCYGIGKVVGGGVRRLIFLLPIISLFLFLPLTLSTVHLSGTVGFFLAWLANFKLILFAFQKGPLSHPNISFPRFAALACLPIKIKQKPHFHTHPLIYAAKGLAVAVMVKIYDYAHLIHPNLLMCLYCFHIYFLLEIILAAVAAVARALLGLELEPQFDNPIRSTSLQDFWGRRWNLMVTTILRPTVYEPTLRAAMPFLGPRWAPLPAVLGTFVVSGLMHELILFYIGRLRPTFLMTAFFLLHGLCLTLEIVLKRALTASCRLPWFLSGPLTAGFVFATCTCLFLPEFIRCRIDVRAFQEYADLGHLVKNLASQFFHAK
ncbi:hypothetical protein Fmac_022739 [Flemingia macrophylla]|uniref:Wax synthase domain-containing protein n=1 Tax=Flemingia macrophylla TaxID=520843 RepID=A0ABD1M0Z1_9FABA